MAPKIYIFIETYVFHANIYFNCKKINKTKFEKPAHMIARENNEHKEIKFTLDGIVT
jgi:hypothetical protein